MDDPRVGTENFCFCKTGQVGPREVQTGKPESKFSLAARSRTRRDRYAVWMKLRISRYVCLVLSLDSKLGVNIDKQYYVLTGLEWINKR